MRIVIDRQEAEQIIGRYLEDHGFVGHTIEFNWGEYQNKKLPEPPLYDWTGKWDLVQASNGLMTTVVLTRIEDTDYYWITYKSERGTERIQHSFDVNGNSNFGKLINRLDTSYSGG